MYDSFIDLDLIEVNLLDLKQKVLVTVLLPSNATPVNVHSANAFVLSAGHYMIPYLLILITAVMWRNHGYYLSFPCFVLSIGCCHSEQSYIKYICFIGINI